MNFNEKLSLAVEKNDSLLCIGLDPDPALMPEGWGALDFNKAIIDATADLVCAYKPNFAFYEALGAECFDVLKNTIEHIPAGIPVIADAKRGDIGNTARMYAEAIFSALGCDAATVSPYLGFDSIEPFITHRDRGVFILCRTSNPGSADLQSLECRVEGESMPLYLAVAHRAGLWNAHGNIGLVVGATYPEELKAVRQRQPQMTILIPGIGTQGGDLEKVTRFGTDARGAGAIICSSRQVLYASRGKDFAMAARAAAASLRDSINRYRGRGPSL